MIETLPPDYTFADSLIAALIEAGALTPRGITYERARNQYRVERDGRFIGYARALIAAVKMQQEGRR